MFERPKSGESALLVHPAFGRSPDPADTEEFRLLAKSAGADIVDIVLYSRAKPESRFLIGGGKLEELAEQVEAEGIELLLFNHTLSPSQERNIESACHCRVLDRTGLILDIFAQRARSYEGKLQVELAQLRYISTRLVRGWTHLERQKGGIGMRGPGETQLETDRRLLAVRVKSLEKRLAKVRSQRNQGRQARRKKPIPTVALVGYTNAGKSTLFNTLTDSKVYQADQLFATLDPTLRRLQLEGFDQIILADTVGFIQDLPHDLVEAFHATLQETVEADLLLHVVDASNPQRNEHIREVNTVLEMINAESCPQILVYNKIDQINQMPHIDIGDDNRINRIWVSALESDGLPLLHSAMVQFFSEGHKIVSLQLPPAQGDLRALLHEHHSILEEAFDPEGFWQIKARISVELMSRFKDYLVEQTTTEHEQENAEILLKSE